MRDDPDLEIFECDDCGLVFLSSTEVPEGFYEESKMHGSEPIQIDQWMSETDQDDERRFNYLADVLPGQDVLDYGCGVGGFLMKARRMASTVNGIEVETRLREHHDRHELEVVRSIDELPADKRFDLVTAFHVIEHLADPAGTLRQLAGRLKVGGMLIVEVPSSMDALLTLYECIPFSEFTYWSCHPYLFNASNLDRLAELAGLKLQHVSQIQRYPLSNHLYWLAKGQPGGHQVWVFFDDEVLSKAYEERLAALGLTDTLIARLSV